jgi:outer membrane lipoprotein LolB
MPVCKKVTMLRIRWHVIAALVLPLVLTGCASLAPSADTTQPPPSTSAIRTYRDSIDLAGRLSVRYQQNGKEESVHGNFTWAQADDLTHIVLLSPLGQTLATIEVARGTATLTQAGQAPRVADNVDALAADALGWPLPISGLRTWLQGFAFDASGRPVTATPETTGGAAIMTPDGWRIDYANWDAADVPQAPTRPKRIDLERTTAQAGNVSLRIVIDNWQAH